LERVEVMLLALLEMLKVRLPVPVDELKVPLPAPLDGAALVKDGTDHKGTVHHNADATGGP
jgi:hypothetical protein